MKVYLECKTRREAKLLRAGLRHKDIRALVVVMGALDPLEDEETKVACLDAAVQILDVKNQREQRKRGQLL